VSVQSEHRVGLDGRQLSCHKSEMSKIVEQWLLFKYMGLEFTPLSKPFKRANRRRKRA
jgi:hypothetical protein